MAEPISVGAGERDRPHWLPWSAFPFQTRYVGIAGQRIHYVDEGSGPALLLVSAGQWSFMFRDVIARLRGRFRCLTLDFPGCGLSPGASGHDHSVRANAQILEGFIDALDLQDITMAVHDVGGPLGFLVATRWPERFRALVISNTFGWPLAGYPAVRRTLKVIASPPFGAVNSLVNVVALFTESRYGVGRNMTRSDRRAFLGPWRSRNSRHATRQILAGVLRIDPMMAEAERSLPSALAGLPVLTLFGRKNDPYGWQDRFQQIFPRATAVGIPDGHHFPFNDDPRGLRLRDLHLVGGESRHGPWAIRKPLRGVNQMSADNVLGTGRTALVTGASRGIGPLIARQIASHGGHVVLTGRSAADLKAVTADLAADGADVSFIPADLTRLLRAILDYFPALGPALNRAAGATTTMQKIIERREAESDAAA